MATTKIKSYLPVFPGFYGTIFEADETNEIYSYNQDNNTNKVYDDFEWDYDSYQKSIAEDCVRGIERELNGLGFKVSIRFENIYSPREYNFSNDSINVTYKLATGCIKAIQKYLKANYEAWAKHIKDNFTSYDGFISFHTNNEDDWYKKVTIAEMERESIVAGIVFEFILANEGFTQSDLYEKTETYLSYEVKEFELNDLTDSEKTKAINQYKIRFDISSVIPEYEVIDLIEAAGIKYDYSGNALNMPELEPEITDPNQLSLFE